MRADKPGAVLLDTHIFLWSILDPGKLSRQARRVLEASNTRAYLSVASIWEISLKSAKGKLNAPDATIDAQIKDLGIIALPITHAHVRILSTLTFGSDHKDPFDRLIAAQAVSERLPLITADEAFQQYAHISVIW